ncbi:DUF6492 family protein [Cyanobium sp. ULC084]
MGNSHPIPIYGEPPNQAQGLTVVTPSYAPDLELFADLRTSIETYASEQVTHLVVTPSRDVKMFRTRFAGPLCEVVAVEDILPKSIRSVPGVNAWVNLRAPWPPVRGWIAQQLVKLSVADFITTDALLLVDSDVAFVRPFSAETFIHKGVVQFYRVPEAIDTHMPRHIAWHRVARELLGIPQTSSLLLPDYISAMTPWDRRLVLQLRSRVEEVSGRRWIDSIGSQAHFSEFIIYGVFLDELFPKGHPGATKESLCHFYWDTKPLCNTSAAAFMCSLPESDVAVMISAKSGTPLEVRRRALQEWKHD